MSVLLGRVETCGWFMPGRFVSLFDGKVDRIFVVAAVIYSLFAVLFLVLMLSRPLLRCSSSLQRLACALVCSPFFAFLN
jgi:hypothetical protein